MYSPLTNIHEANFLFRTILFSIAFSGLFKNDNNSNTEGQAKVQMVLTDAPGLAYDALYLDIREVSINNSTTDEGWVPYPVGSVFAQPINILDYRNGKTIAIGDPLSLPAGKIEQIRLVLGDKSTIVVNGQTEKLTVPSGVVKVNLHQELLPNGVYKIWVDFDAARSVKVHGTGSGKYILRPVIKAFVDQANGQIRGYVKPAEAEALVYALKGGYPRKCYTCYRWFLPVCRSSGR
ncbi:DUF4382 domain-containing protein [Niabella sp. W65]|nr:DUF4382 domain-containing protein [Niabella sp. W65]MCH7369049.1 DUF4382 domain-containing protein [Niabella sp. W65]ULT44614.1 DUF4382 domain-containing protein [Niabella sp. I65]